MMLIGDQIGNMPGQKIEGISREMSRFVKHNSGFHGNRFDCKRRRLHEGSSSLQALVRMLKTAYFSPAHPWRAETRRLPQVRSRRVPEKLKAKYLSARI